MANPRAINTEVGRFALEVASAVLGAVEGQGAYMTDVFPALERCSREDCRAISDRINALRARLGLDPDNYIEFGIISSGFLRAERAQPPSM
jgi:hypothetical protein